MNLYSSFHSKAKKNIVNYFCKEKKKYFIEKRKIKRESIGMATTDPTIPEETKKLIC